jgi:hypothetical protein
MFSSNSMEIPIIEANGDEGGDVVGRRIMSGGLAVAMRTGMVRAGVGLKSVMDELMGSRASAVAADAGIVVGTDELALSVAMRNMGTVSSNLPGDRESLPVEFRSGLSFVFKPLSVLAAVEYAKSSDRSGDADAGVAWSPSAAFGIRVGLAGIKEGGRQVTFGLSGGYQRIVLDYAFGAHPLGLNHRASLTYLFGPAGGAVAAASRPPEAPADVVKEETPPIAPSPAEAVATPKL